MLGHRTGVFMGIGRGKGGDVMQEEQGWGKVEADLHNGDGSFANSIKQGRSMVSELAKGPGQVGQVLLAELLGAPFCFTAKPGHQAVIVKACRQRHNLVLLPKPLPLQMLRLASFCAHQRQLSGWDGPDL